MAMRKTVSQTLCRGVWSTDSAKFGWGVRSCEFSLAIWKFVKWKPLNKYLLTRQGNVQMSMIQLTYQEISSANKNIGVVLIRTMPSAWGKNLKKFHLRPCPFLRAAYFLSIRISKDDPAEHKQCWRWLRCQVSVLLNIRKTYHFNWFNSKQLFCHFILFQLKDSFNKFITYH